MVFVLTKTKKNLPIEWMLQLKQLFVPYGFRSLSMDDISSQLGISKKTLYQYVSNKETLLIAYLDWRISTFRKEVKLLKQKEQKPQKEFTELIFMISVFLFDFTQKSISDLEHYYPKANNAYQQFRNKQLIKLIIKNFERGNKDGIYLKNIATKFSAEILLLSLENIINNQLTNFINKSKKALIQNLVDHHLSAISIDKS